MSARPDIEALRRQLAASERGFGPGVPSFSLGASALDEAIPCGLPRGALHEVFAAEGRDAAAASGFAAGLAVRAAHAGKTKKDIVWVRQRFGVMESGALHAAGLAELGLDPDKLILVDVRDAGDALRAGEEAARCSVLGAVLIEVWRDPKALDLTASRRLALAAERSGVPLMMLRAGADPAPSAAATRWSVRPAPSRPLEADAPGHPVFALKLLRHRGQAAGRSWLVEWRRESGGFVDGPDVSQVSRSLASLPAGEPADAGERRAG